MSEMRIDKIRQQRDDLLAALTKIAERVENAPECHDDMGGCAHECCDIARDAIAKVRAES